MDQYRVKRTRATRAWHVTTACRYGLPLLFASVLIGCARRPSDLSHVILSYEENPSWCANCPHYRVEFSSPDLVRFFGLSGCAVPGQRVLHMPPGSVADLERAFHDANFFNIPRRDTTRIVFDATIVTVTYRDARRVHETIDEGRSLPRLAGLEKRLREAAKVVDRFLNPSIAVYQELLASGWNVNTVGADGENALTAAVTGDAAAARFLLGRGAAVSKMALELPVLIDDVDLFKALMEAREPDLKAEESLELLLLAAGRSTKILRLLLARGANPNDRSSERETPLGQAASSGSMERVRVLLSSGADVRLVPDLMSKAVSQEDSGMITLLAQHGAAVNAHDQSGRTPLIVAADSCKYWHIGPLLAAGADPSIPGTNGRTALQPETAITTSTESCRRSAALVQEAVRSRRQDQ